MIRLKKPEEIVILKEGGSILAQTLKAVAVEVKPGVRAADLDALAEKFIRAAGALPAFKGYQGFPATLCISVNDEVVHGIPGTKIMKDGDIVGIDCGVEYKGLFTDAAITLAVGKISKSSNFLLQVTRDALQRAISVIHAGATIGDIGHAVQEYVEAQGCSVVRALVGHGVGHAVHEDPKIPNYGESGTGEKLKEGMVLAIEPMVNAGGYMVRTAPDRWTVVTADGSKSAHFEHTVAVTSKGCEVLTV